MTYVFYCFKKGNKKGSLYELDIDSVTDMRSHLYHIIRQWKLKNAGEMRKMGEKISITIPDNAFIITVSRRTTPSIIGAVILVPGRGTWWGTKKNRGYVYKILHPTGKLGSGSESKL